ncbi:segregation/condensation protein A [Geomonas paludis]|uniref:Segregation and condensation protein A n=1 Tax=Geomonas paludis TaxID=2740185 RepID=A0A6V8MTE2_9BACT|nr:segregation/condensation protein A [Geomonas paludis]UPU38054.1 segregation/condensation protein A [Geomonas paludis]GFO63418.1 segregation and condensation protein A [Geomonas paludis]
MSLEEMQSNLFSEALEQSYRVQIEEFEGPLDLLLHLIKKNEVDIYNIPIAAITRQYLDYMEIMKDLNLDIAGEFLVMAATLLQIKSRMLLPVTPEEDADGEVEDPRAELVRRLLEYQRYRDASQMLNCRNLLGREVFARKFDSPELGELDPVEEPADVELFELIEAFQKVLARVSVDTFHDVVADGISIADRIGEVLSILHAEKTVCFDSLFNTGMTRDLLVVTFLSILELCKLKLIKVVQMDSMGSIWLHLAAKEEGEGEGGEEGEGVAEGTGSV